MDTTTPSPAPPPAGPDRLRDDAEVANFNRLADEWWNPRGKFAVLHEIGPLRTGYVRRMAEMTLGVDAKSIRPLVGRTVLDVGCGGGLVAEPLARLGGAVTAIDLAPESIAVARAHAEGQGLAIDYRCEALERLAERGEMFDVVTCLEVLEHIPDPAKFVALLARVTKPGGVLALSTINRTPQAFALAIVGAEYVLGWIPRGTHRWDRFIRPSELEAWCAAAGLSSLGAEGMVLNPLAGTWRLARDTSVNYFASAVRRV